MWRSRVQKFRVKVPALVLSVTYPSTFLRHQKYLSVTSVHYITRLDFFYRNMCTLRGVAFLFCFVFVCIILYYLSL